MDGGDYNFSSFKFPTAENCCQKSNEAVVTANQTILTEIAKDIEIAAQKGLFSIERKGYINDNVKAFLTSHPYNYNITTTEKETGSNSHDSYYESWHVISWNKL